MYLLWFKQNKNIKTFLLTLLKILSYGYVSIYNQLGGKKESRYYSHWTIIEQYNSLIESQKRLKELEKVDLSQKEKDTAKMSKEEFFAMIDKRRKSKSIEMSMEEMQKILLE